MKKRLGMIVFVIVCLLAGSGEGDTKEGGEAHFFGYKYCNGKEGVIILYKFM